MFTVKWVAFYIFLSCCANAANVTMDVGDAEENPVNLTMTEDGIVDVEGNVTITEEIAASRAKGEKIVSKIESLLSDPSLSATLKKELDAEIEKAVEEQKNLSISDSFSNDSTVRYKRHAGYMRDITDKNCCKVSIRPIMRHTYYMTTTTCGERYTYYYRERCGWWGRCQRSRQSHRYYTCYERRSMYYYVAGTCPYYYKTCCPHYTWYRGYCFENDFLESMLCELTRRALELQHLGCFSAWSSRRNYCSDDSPVSLPRDSNPEDCVQSCRWRRQGYATVDYTGGCSCGDQEGGYVSLSRYGCQSPCSVYNGCMCGNTGRSNVYATEVRNAN